MILDVVLLPEAVFFLAFLIFFILLWVILRRIKGLGRTMAVLELGHLESYYQSSAMRKCRLRLMTTERTDMKALHVRSAELLSFFDRIGFLVQKGTLSMKEMSLLFACSRTIQPILGVTILPMTH